MLTAGIRATMWLPEGFILGQMKRIRESIRGLPYDLDGPNKNPAFNYSNSERDAFAELIRRGLCETVHELDNMVIRVKAEAPPPAPAKQLPYEETPALLAMRARRRLLGR